MLRTVSHNVRSLKQHEAIELVISYIRRHGVGIYCMQETWLPGSSIMSNKGHIIIFFNKDDAHRRGVGIVLASAFIKA